jgi:ribose 5-phosphate isomerase B
MSRDKIINIGCDHAGFSYKQAIVDWLTENGWEVQDMGTYSPDSVDYPDFVHPLAESIENGQSRMGILICGSGNGVAMTANKHSKIRAAVCWNENIVKLARQHNDSNIIALPARFISKEDALRFVQIFLNTDFEGGRHLRRVNKISQC